MAGNILPKVNVSSASLSEPFQAGAEQRSFCPTVFSPWTWGWQGSAHTQLRRRQCSLGGPAAWSPEAGLCPGNECPGQPSCTQAWCLLRITASSEVLPSPRISTCCHLPCVLTLSRDLGHRKGFFTPFISCLLPAPE